MNNQKLLNENVDDQENQNKLVSFVVPIYKTEQYLKKCLESLINQSYKNIEIICVMDGFSQKALDIVSSFHNNKIKNCFTITHGGAPKARNEGFKHTKGDYVSFWDSDCYAEPDMVMAWITVFKVKKVDFVYSGYRLVDVDKSFLPSEEFYPYLLTCNNYIATMFPMRRDIFPGFDESLESLQDWDMWLTITEKGYKGFMLEGSGFFTELRNDSISSKGCTDKNWLERYNKVRDKHNIKNRDICFCSAIFPYRGLELAEIYKQDFLRMPSFKPNEYKIIYNIGFYANTSHISSQMFKDAKKRGQVTILHWMGDDIEDILNKVSYNQVKNMHIYLNLIDYHTCENETAKQMLNEIGIKAIIRPLPINYQDVSLNKEFKVYYESDGAYDELLNQVKRSCPDIKIETISDGITSLTDYNCYLSITGSIMPSENLKKFLVSGKYVITNYNILYGGTVKPELKIIVEKIREYKKLCEKGILNKEPQRYYRELLSLDKFIEGVKKCQK